MKGNVEAARRVWEERLLPEDFARELARVLAERDEIEASKELIRWFRRRYPTAGERLRYARRKYAEWTRAWPIEPDGG